LNLARRLALEEALLRRYFGSTFRVHDRELPSVHAVGMLRTNAGNEYGLLIRLAGFPDQAPAAFIVSPDLRRASGRRLPEFSHAMHTLEPNEYGHVAPCLYQDSSWTASTSIYKVVLKTRIWLEGYEAHVRTGRPLDAFLPHIQ
jgi:hypothetical protein